MWSRKMMNFWNCMLSVPNLLEFLPWSGARFLGSWFVALMLSVDILLCSRSAFLDWNIRQRLGEGTGAFLTFLYPCVQLWIIYCEIIVKILTTLMQFTPKNLEDRDFKNFRLVKWKPWNPGHPTFKLTACHPTRSPPTCSAYKFFMFRFLVEGNSGRTHWG